MPSSSRTRHELPIVDALRSEVDALPVQELEPEIDLTEMPGEVELPPDPLPPDPVAEFVARIVGDDSLSAALARFGACLPTEADAPGVGRRRDGTSLVLRDPGS